MLRLLPNYIKRIYRDINIDIPKPLGRWILIEKPYINNYYDNSMDIDKGNDLIEFQIYTKGCLLKKKNNIYICTNCKNDINIHNIDSNYVLNNKLHPSRCLNLN